jgi:excinuclease UvrABC nuclease subunit
MNLMNDIIIEQNGYIWYMDRLYIPDISVVYFIYNSKKEVIYIGQTKRLLKRTKEHFCQEMWFKLFARYLSYVESPPEELRVKEFDLIQEFKPKYNFEHYSTSTEGEMKAAVQGKPII